jgi:hypothetical protein
VSKSCLLGLKKGKNSQNEEEENENPSEQKKEHKG